MHEEHLSIVVAALTRRRPNMVASLIKSLGTMKLPDNCTIQCLIVENDDSPKTQSIIQNLLPLPNDLELTYALETEQGIPFGRNRAAKDAIAMGADLLAFIDDDETVEIDWLINLVDAYRTSGAPLVGGPVRVAPEVKNLSWLERAMHAGVEKSFKKIEEGVKSSTKERPQTIVTNNWLAETKLFTHYNLQFDPKMRLTGGTDSKFCRDVWNLGLKTYWEPTAIVLATMPKDRLSFSYQFRNARDRTMTRFHMLHTQRKAARLRLLASVPFKALVSIALLTALPFTNGKSIFALATTTGWIVGRIGAIFGKRSTLYSKLVGN